MVVNPCAVLKSIRTKYLFIILMSVIYFEWNGSYGKAALKLKKFSLWKSSLFEINLNQMTIIDSFSVRFDRLVDRDGSLCLSSFWGKEQLAVKLPNDFSVKIIMPRNTAD